MTFTVTFMTGLTQENPLNKDNDLSLIIEHLYLMNMLSRISANLQILIQFKAPQFPIQIAKLATVKLIYLGLA